MPLNRDVGRSGSGPRRRESGWPTAAPQLRGRRWSKQRTVLCHSQVCLLKPAAVARCLSGLAGPSGRASRRTRTVPGPASGPCTSTAGKWWSKAGPRFCLTRRPPPAPNRASRRSAPVGPARRPAGWPLSRHGSSPAGPPATGGRRWPSRCGLQAWRRLRRTSGHAARTVPQAGVPACPTAAAAGHGPGTRWPARGRRPPWPAGAAGRAARRATGTLRR